MPGGMPEGGPDHKTGAPCNQDQLLWPIGIHSFSCVSLDGNKGLHCNRRSPITEEDHSQQILRRLLMEKEISRIRGTPSSCFTNTIRTHFCAGCNPFLQFCTNFFKINPIFGFSNSQLSPIKHKKPRFHAINNDYPPIATHHHKLKFVPQSTMLTNTIDNLYRMRINHLIKNLATLTNRIHDPVSTHVIQMLTHRRLT